MCIRWPKWRLEAFNTPPPLRSENAVIVTGRATRSGCRWLDTCACRLQDVIISGEIKAHCDLQTGTHSSLILPPHTLPASEPFAAKICMSRTCSEARTDLTWKEQRGRQEKTWLRSFPLRVTRVRTSEKFTTLYWRAKISNLKKYHCRPKPDIPSS